MSNSTSKRKWSLFSGYSAASLLEWCFQNPEGFFFDKNPTMGEICQTCKAPDLWEALDECFKEYRQELESDNFFKPEYPCVPYRNDAEVPLIPDEWLVLHPQLASPTEDYLRSCYGVFYGTAEAYHIDDRFPAFCMGKNKEIEKSLPHLSKKRELCHVLQSLESWHYSTIPEQYASLCANADAWGIDARHVLDMDEHQISAVIDLGRHDTGSQYPYKDYKDKWKLPVLPEDLEFFPREAVRQVEKIRKRIRKLYLEPDFSWWVPPPRIGEGEKDYDEEILECFGMKPEPKKLAGKKASIVSLMVEAERCYIAGTPNPYLYNQMVQFKDTVYENERNLVRTVGLGPASLLKFFRLLEFNRPPSEPEENMIPSLALAMFELAA